MQDNSSSGARAIVRTKPRGYLEHHRETKSVLHHPPDEQQLEYGGREALVKTVLEYHGGELVYELEEIPGLWRFDCIEEVTRILECDSCNGRFRLPALNVAVVATCPHCDSMQDIGGTTPATTH